VAEFKQNKGTTKARLTLSSVMAAAKLHHLTITTSGGKDLMITKTAPYTHNADLGAYMMCYHTRDPRNIDLANDQELPEAAKVAVEKHLGFTIHELYTNLSNTLSFAKAPMDKVRTRWTQSRQEAPRNSTYAIFVHQGTEHALQLTISIRTCEAVNQTQSARPGQELPNRNARTHTLPEETAHNSLKTNWRPRFRISTRKLWQPSRQHRTIWRRASRKLLPRTLTLPMELEPRCCLDKLSETFSTPRARPKPRTTICSRKSAYKRGITSRPWKFWRLKQTN